MSGAVGATPGCPVHHKPASWDSACPIFAWPLRVESGSHLVFVTEGRHRQYPLELSNGGEDAKIIGGYLAWLCGLKCPHQNNLEDVLCVWVWVGVWPLTFHQG